MRFTAFRVANEMVAFLLELGALAALATWGASIDAGVAARTVVAIAAPALAATVWGAFAAPKARVTLPTAGRLAVKAGVFGAATAALSATSHGALAVGYAVVVIVNTTVLTLDRERGATERPGGR